jgi:hypothetical protein
LLLNPETAHQFPVRRLDHGLKDSSTSLDYLFGTFVIDGASHEYALNAGTEDDIQTLNKNLSRVSLSTFTRYDSIANVTTLTRKVLVHSKTNRCATDDATLDFRHEKSGRHPFPFQSILIPVCATQKFLPCIDFSKARRKVEVFRQHLPVRIHDCHFVFKTW